jgi:mannose/cellobiose epimerase-like protein (N-acyl-D-glucosamine 2-epimerase family)
MESTRRRWPTRHYLETALASNKTSDPTAISGLSATSHHPKEAYMEDNKRGGEFDIWIEPLCAGDALVGRSGGGGGDSNNFAC